MYGATPNRDATDAAWMMALDIEEAMAQRQELYATLLDNSKYFDYFKRHILWPMLVYMRAPVALIRTIAAFYAQGRRYMKIAGHYGEQFHPGNGIGQGDPLSMRFVNGARWIWIKMMKVNFADTRLGVYVDDRSIRTKDRATMQKAIAKTAKLD